MNHGKFKANGSHRFHLSVAILILAINIVYYPQVLAPANEIANKEKAIAVIKKAYHDSQAAIYLYNQPISKGIKIKSAYQSKNHNPSSSFIIEKPSWLFIVDETPFANFSHPITIRLIDADTQNIDNKQYTFHWWPKIYDKNNNNQIPYFAQVFSQNTESMNNSMFTLIDKPSNPPQLQELIDDRGKGFYDSPFPHADQLIGRSSNSKFGKNTWAILVCGHLANGDTLAFAKDTDCMYSVLTGHGVPAGQIKYFLPQQVKEEIKSLHPYQTSFQFKNTDASKKLTKDDIANAIKTITGEFEKNPGGKFIFLISTHGSHHLLSLKTRVQKKAEEAEEEEEYIDLDDLVTWFQNIKSNNIYILIDACFSGSFIEATYDPILNKVLLNPNPCIFKKLSPKRNLFVIVSACGNEKSYSDIDDDTPQSMENNEDRGTEFLGGFIEAFTKKEADLPPKDGKISLGEAFKYAYDHSFNTSNLCSKSKDCNHPVSLPDIEKMYTEFLFWEADK